MAAAAIPFKLDVTKARSDGYSDDEILDHLGQTKSFNVQQALQDGYSKQELLEHLSGQSALDPSHGHDSTDSIINFLRPLLSSGGAALASPLGPVASAGAYVGTDALLQHMQTNPQQGLASKLTDSEPGGLASTLLNTGEQYLTGKVFEGATGALGRGIKALRNADQPEIYNLQPTTSQAAKSYGMNKLAAVTRVFENSNRSAKNAALDRTAGRGFSEALETARDVDLIDPQLMLQSIQQDMPLGPGSMSHVSFKQNQAPYTPITIKELPNQVTPITLTDKTSMVGGQVRRTELLPGEVKDLKTPSGRYQVTGGPEEQAPIPGSYTAQAGKSNFNELAESFSKLDSVIRDPKKLQEVLARAQELGTGDNLKKSLGGYQFMKIFNAATTRDLTKNASFMQDNVVRIDPQKLAETWLDPEMQASFRTLYNAQQRADITQFFKNVAFTQDKLQLDPGTRGIITKRLSLIGGGAILAHGIAIGNLIPTAGAAGVTGLYLGAQKLGSMLTNPRTARLFVAMAGGEPLGMSDQMASRIIAQALNGSTVALVNSDGTKTPGEIQDGRFIPQR